MLYFFILSKLLFFLVLYESSGLCGHAVIEKMQKIIFLTYFLPIFAEPKLVTWATQLRWEGVRAILEGFINLSHSFVPLSNTCTQTERVSLKLLVATKNRLNSTTWQIWSIQNVSKWIFKTLCSLARPFGPQWLVKCFYLSERFASTLSSIFVSSSSKNGRILILFIGTLFLFSLIKLFGCQFFSSSFIRYDTYK